MSGGSPLSRLPSVDAVLKSPAVAPAVAVYSRPVVRDVIRGVIAEWRIRLAAGGACERPDEEAVGCEALARLALSSDGGLRRCINATGVVLHTGLGRAVLARGAGEAVYEAAVHPVPIATDYATGKRAPRDRLVEASLCRLCGAEAARVVNNNAAAVLVTLTALAAGRKVVVSRGELVEIGGSFRVPDVIRQGGAQLVEVGTTNRTHLRDYEAAIDDDVAVLLKVHQSNYRIRGFTAQVGIAELADLAHRRGVLLVEDLGSGCVTSLRPYGIVEPTPAESLREGADVVTFSCDKLMGGPQAGAIVGRAALVARIKDHPLVRALRTDKLTLAALHATLVIHENGEAFDRIPFHIALTRTPEDLRATAESVAARLRRLAAPGVAIDVIPEAAEAGSGALPTFELPTYAIRLRVPDVPDHDLAARLRQAQPAIFTRSKDGVLLDVRTVRAEDLDLLVEAVGPVIAAARSSAVD